jgi:hypothetical protein
MTAADAVFSALKTYDSSFGHKAIDVTENPQIQEVPFHLIDKSFLEMQSSEDLEKGSRAIDRLLKTANPRHTETLEDVAALFEEVIHPKREGQPRFLGGMGAYSQSLSQALASIDKPASAQKVRINPKIAERNAAKLLMASAPHLASLQGRVLNNRAPIGLERTIKRAPSLFYASVIVNSKESTVEYALKYAQSKGGTLDDIAIDTIQKMALITTPEITKGLVDALMTKISSEEVAD